MAGATEAERTATDMRTMIGVDLAKNVFQAHGAEMSGEILFRKKLTRAKFREFMAGQEPAVVVLEACGSAHYWARELRLMEHEVKLIAPQYVRPFVKRMKNDAADAEAIVVAAQRPEMRFVEPKTEEQQAKAFLFRSRERLVHQRTEIANAVRSGLYEFGYVVPQGIRQIVKVQGIIDDPDCGLPEMVIEEVKAMLEQIAWLTDRINRKTARIKELAARTDQSRQLQTMPGIGPMTALAIDAFAPPMEQFKCGRHFAAWLGLVPRQFSSGGKERLGRVSKAGQADIRRLLTIGAMSRLNWMRRNRQAEATWLARMTARKPRMLVAIALANKMARGIWAMLTRGEDFRDPALAVAA